MGGLTVLAEVLANGGKVVWDTAPPRLLVPHHLRARVEAERAVIREVLRRATVFRGQARTHGPCPYLHLPGAPKQEQGCLSCGEPLGDTQPLRCPLCVLAALLALGWPISVEVFE